MQCQVHLITTNEPHPLNGGRLHGDEAIFGLIGKRDGNELAGHCFLSFTEHAGINQDHTLLRFAVP
jgi:hypothetical protein